MNERPARRDPRLWLGAAIATGYLLTLSSESYDDAFIIFRYAARLCAGRGLTYNDGERILGVTTPLWTLLCAAGSFLGPLPIVAGIGSTLALGAAACLLAAEHEGPGRAFLPVALLLCPICLMSAGGEMGLVALLAALTCRLAAAGREIPAFALAGLAFLARPDAFLLFAMCAVLWPVAGRGIPWRGALASLLVVAPWLVFSWAYFGSPLPRTVIVKRIQGTFPWQQPFFRGLGRMLADRLAAEPALWSLAILCAIGTIALRRLPVSRLVAIWALLHVAALRALHVPWYHWYAVPVAVLLAVLAAAGLDLLWREGSGRRLRRAVAIAAVAASTFGLVRAGEGRRATARMAWRQTYKNMGLRLAGVAAAGDAVAYNEVGYLGYYSGLRVVDLMGLVSPIDLDRLRAGDFSDAVIRQSPEWVIVKEREPHVTGTLPVQPWFASSYQVHSKLADLTLYRKVREPRRAGAP